MANKLLWLACAICVLQSACVQRSPTTVMMLSPGVYKIQVEGEPSLTLPDLQNKIADKALALCDAGFSYQSLLDLAIKPSLTYSENETSEDHVTVVSRLIVCHDIPEQ